VLVVRLEMYRNINKNLGDFILKVITTVLKNKNCITGIVCIVVLLCCCVSIHFVFKRYLIKNNKLFEDNLLGVYAQQVEKLIIKDFQNILTGRVGNSDLIIIKNSEAYYHNGYPNVHQNINVSNNVLTVYLEGADIKIDISNMKHALDLVARQLFLYNLTINNKNVFTNTINDMSSSKNFTLLVDKDTMISLNLSHHNDSSIISTKRTYLENLINISKVLLTTFFVMAFSIMLYIFRQKVLLAREKRHKSDILYFMEKNRDYITSCYNFSKESNLTNKDGSVNTNYFPLSVENYNQNQKEIKIEVHKFISELRDYAEAYKNYYQIKNVKIEIISNEKEILIPFDYQVFIQVMISIFYNLISFNQKTDKERNILLTIKKDNFCITSEGLKLNKEYAVKASEMIFYDSINPYLINFGQIFVILNRYGIYCDVDYKNYNGTTINMTLPTKKNNPVEIIDLNKYKSKKT